MHFFLPLILHSRAVFGRFAAPDVWFTVDRPFWEYRSIVWCTGGNGMIDASPMSVDP